MPPKPQTRHANPAPVEFEQVVRTWMPGNASPLSAASIIQTCATTPGPTTYKRARLVQIASHGTGGIVKKRLIVSAAGGYQA